MVDDCVAVNNVDHHDAVDTDVDAESDNDFTGTLPLCSSRGRRENNQNCFVLWCV